MHRQPSRWSLYQRRGRCQNQPRLLHQRQPHRAHLVLRPQRSQGQKKNPLTLEHFADFLKLLPTKADSDRSWTVTRDEIEAKKYDLKAVNPNAKSNEDTRTPEELLAVIEDKGKEVNQALIALRRM